MDAAFLNQPSYLYPIEVRNSVGGGGGTVRVIVYSLSFFPRCLKVSRGCTLQDDANMTSDVILNT